MLYATVRNRKIHVKRPDTVVQNGVNVDWLQLDMDDEWQSMDSIVCVFMLHYTEESTSTQETTVTTTITEKEVQKEMLHTFGKPVMVPWECLEHTGMLSVNCTGYVRDEDGESQKVMTTAYPDSYWEVVQNGPMSGEETLEPTPSLYDQIVAAAGAATAAAADAEEARNQLLQDKANGVFDGKDGESTRVTVGNTVTGPPGTSANVYQTGDDSNCVLNFTIPRGDPGPVPSALPNPYPLSLNIEGMQIDYDGSREVVAQIAPKEDDVGVAIMLQIRNHNESPTAHEDIRDAIPTVPNALPNPNKLTFTGAVEAEYDGSSAVVVNIPAGGGADVSLGITGAAVGQIAKITAVDAAGRPTAWEAADMTGGGGTMHAITWNLANVTSSNAIAEISDGAALVATLSPADGYKLGDVSVTMGGTAQTDVWDTDTSTLTIPSVTGDVVVFCTGVEDEPVGSVDTSPVIAEYDKGLSNTAGTINNFPGICYTKVYSFTLDLEAIHSSRYYDAENDYSTAAGAFGLIMVYTPSAKLHESDYSLSGLTTQASKIWLYRDGAPFWSLSNSSLAQGTVPESPIPSKFPRYNSDALYANGVAFSLSMLELEDSYTYWGTSDSGVYPVGVRAGDIIFAGKNTPYYGMANIDGTLPAQNVQALSVDQDIAMDYPVSTTSVLGSTPAADSGTSYGVSTELTTLITEAKNAWMTEYGGDYRKIPLIITTDQHGRTNAGIFKLLGSTLSMYDVSKICNLGDTVSVEWKDEDADHPLLSCAGLEKWCESVKDIPYSKQFNVFGNHDTWYANYEDEGNPIGTRYPSSQAHLNQYFRNIYARRINNNGWFAVKDEQFNVKYVVISGFEYKSGVAFRIGTEQMDWIIKELSIDDGYDIVIVSHVPLYYQDTTNYWPTDMESSTPDSTTIMRPAEIDTDALFNARKSKSIGTVTDSDGVEHKFDFSGCSSNILCGLHGHTHIDAYNYVGGAGLMNATFDWFADNTLHFILIDRVSEQVNVWKVEGTALKTTNYQIPLDKPSE